MTKLLRNKPLIKRLGLIALAAVLILIGFKTPFTGEAQLIGKAYLMMMVCYAVILGLVSSLSLTAKKISFFEFLRHWFYFFFAVVVCLYMVNVPFDLIMSALSGRYLPNEACTVAAFILLFTTMGLELTLMKTKK